MILWGYLDPSTTRIVLINLLQSWLYDVKRDNPIARMSYNPDLIPSSRVHARARKNLCYWQAGVISKKMRGSSRVEESGERTARHESQQLTRKTR